MTEVKDAKKHLEKRKRKPLIHKNNAKPVPTGRTLQTRDEFLASGKGKKNIKPEHPSPKDLYRRVGVIYSNRKGDCAIVKLDTKGKHSLPDYLNGKSKFKPIIEVEDCDGNRIRVDNPHFKQNSAKKDLSDKQVKKIQNECLVKASPKTKHENFKRLNEIKD